MAGAAYYLKAGISAVFEYDTPKVVHIRSKSIGVLNRLVQLGIIAYIVVWVFVIHKGYQKVDDGVSGSTTKVKGVAYSNLSSDPRVGSRIWDAADLVVPPEENEAFFVTTNLISTLNQTLGQCPEAKSVPLATCRTDSDCPPHVAYGLGHGVTTGKCNTPTGTCEINAWCPLEDDEIPLNGTEAVLIGIQNLTVLIKNHVYFPFYKKTRSNIIESTNKSYLSGCQYHEDTDPFCPVFRLGYIVKLALGKSVSQHLSFDDIAIEGGVIAIRITWDCDFNYDAKSCKPLYDFDRLDKGDDSLIARGYNYRYTSNYFEGGREYRKLVKAFGILFIITVDAQAGAFNAMPTFENIGSGIALLAIATVICDAFVLYIHKNKKFFRDHKYEQVQTSDAYTAMDDNQ